MVQGLKSHFLNCVLEIFQFERKKNNFLLYLLYLFWGQLEADVMIFSNRVQLDLKSLQVILAELHPLYPLSSSVKVIN